MNYECIGKPFRKKSDPKNEKTVKITVKNSNFTSKNHKNVCTDIKKRERPNTIQILHTILHCKKNQEKRMCGY